MSQYYKLTEEQVLGFGLSTYKGEVILYSPEASGGEKFYFNAQENFSESELDSMNYYSE